LPSNGWHFLLDWRICFTPLIVIVHNWIPPDRFFPYFTWQQIDQMPDKERAVIIQPLGSIEQHGYHLPLIVDIAISCAVIGKTLAQLPPDIKVYSLPPLPYGKATEHLDFPGTISLSTNTLFSILFDISESIYRSGFRKLILWNSHGGQPQILELVARDLRYQYRDMLVFPFFTWRVPPMRTLGAELFTEQENLLGIHAGDAETSLMLAIMPDRVLLDQAICAYPTINYNYLSIEGDLPIPWVTKDLSMTGTIGDATAASREKGEKILATLVSAWQGILTEIFHYEQISKQG
jgi:creatinine amidohydrolase